MSSCTVSLFYIRSWIPNKERQKSLQTSKRSEKSHSREYELTVGRRVGPKLCLGLRTERSKVVRGDYLACHRTLVDLILNALANKDEPSPLDHDDHHGRQIHQIHTLPIGTGLTTSVEPEQMENNDRTLKELATPDVVYQPWCIQYPQLEPTQTYELKSGLIHLLPKFRGLAGEDPHKHLKEFHVVYSTMRP
ncbi:hypothetical protein CR513_42656, partial [Mucuna pruriens]